jgi:transcriptional regulator with XRE-family HTH domain
MTQRELAAVAGVSLASLNRLEHEGRPAAASTVRKLAAALSVEPADLMPPDQGDRPPTTS